MNLGLCRQMKRSFLEWQQSALPIACALREDPHAQRLVLDLSNNSNDNDNNDDDNGDDNDDNKSKFNKNKYNCIRKTYQDYMIHIANTSP